jgi:hypothetical protein
VEALSLAGPAGIVVLFLATSCFSSRGLCRKDEDRNHPKPSAGSNDDVQDAEPPLGLTAHLRCSAIELENFFADGERFLREDAL